MYNDLDVISAYDLKNIIFSKLEKLYDILDRSNKNNYVVKFISNNDDDFCVFNEIKFVQYYVNLGSKCLEIVFGLKGNTGVDICSVYKKNGDIRLEYTDNLDGFVSANREYINYSFNVLEELYNEFGLIVDGYKIICDNLKYSYFDEVNNVRLEFGPNGVLIDGSNDLDKDEMLKKINIPISKLSNFYQNNLLLDDFRENEKVRKRK